MTTPTPASPDSNQWKEVADALANALGRVILTSTIHPSMLKVVFGAIEKYVKISTETSEQDDWWREMLNTPPSQMEWDKFMAEHQWPTDTAEGETDNDPFL